MSAPRFEKLTTRQQECLRLYNQRFRIKEIALTLGISQNTVSGYLTEAAAIIDVGDRRAAASAFAAFESASSQVDRSTSVDGIPSMSTMKTGIRPGTRGAAGTHAPERSDDVVLEASPVLIIEEAHKADTSGRASFDDHLYPRGRFEVGDRALPPHQEDGHHRNPAVPTKRDPRPHETASAWVPLRLGDGNDLTITRRFVWLGLVTFLLVSGFGLFAFFIRTISELADG